MEFGQQLLSTLHPGGQQVADLTADLRPARAGPVPSPCVRGAVLVRLEGSCR